MRTLEQIALDLTRVVASIDDDPYGSDEQPDGILPHAAVVLLREVHGELHQLRSRGLLGDDLNFITLQKAALREALRRSDGSMHRAAAMLGIDASTLWRWLRSNGIGNERRKRNGR